MKAFSASVAERAFGWSVTGILTVTGGAKLSSFGGQSRILEQPNAVFGISNGQLMLAVGIVEILVAGFFLFSNLSNAKYYLGAWLSLNFVAYRALSAQLAPGKPCPCLGSIGDFLPMNADTIDLFLKIVVAYIFLGSVALLLFDSRRRALGRTPNESG